MMDTPTVIALVCLGLFALWATYSNGHATGIWRGRDEEADRWRERLDHLRQERATERANGERLLARFNRQQRRLRGVLGEARRWKGVAVSLGWERPRATPASVRPTVVFFGPQPEGTDLEALAATARRLIDRTDVGGGT